MGATADRVRRALRRDILTGALPPGCRLTEASLSARYTVSRVPVREALRGLAAAGLVETRPGRGVRVASVSVDDADDLYAVRTTIEERTARRCALLVAAGTADPAQRLAEIVADGTAAVAAGRSAEVAELNTRFHLTMAAESGSPALRALLGQVADRIQWLYALDVVDRGERSWSEHRDIVAAIAAGDADTAGAVARAHVAASRRGLFESRTPSVPADGTRPPVDADGRVRPPTEHTAAPTASPILRGPLPPMSSPAPRGRH